MKNIIKIIVFMLSILTLGDEILCKSRSRNINRKKPRDDDQAEQMDSARIVVKETIKDLNKISISFSKETDPFYNYGKEMIKRTMMSAYNDFIMEKDEDEKLYDQWKKQYYAKLEKEVENIMKKYKDKINLPGKQTNLEIELNTQKVSLGLFSNYEEKTIDNLLLSIGCPKNKLDLIRKSGYIECALINTALVLLTGAVFIK